MVNVAPVRPQRKSTTGLTRQVANKQVNQKNSRSSLGLCVDRWAHGVGFLRHTEPGPYTHRALAFDYAAFGALLESQRYNNGVFERDGARVAPWSPRVGVEAPMASRLVAGGCAQIASDTTARPVSANPSVTFRFGCTASFDVTCSRRGQATQFGVQGHLKVTQSQQCSARGEREAQSKPQGPRGGSSIKAFLRLPTPPDIRLCIEVACLN
ncbi:hypothetical protein EVAR_46870_1 [Eumeta japonica]|uniref:Uncharacterized protein n=1 Tax=Eumeta variegata TaxID=151549 RepID=A0A4C1XMC8_EUMVA|nr:hypothetical protein EVAR_46870_1 [Eumeta japonica]